MKRLVSCVGFGLILVSVAAAVPWSWPGLVVLLIFALAFVPSG